MRKNGCEYGTPILAKISAEVVPGIGMDHSMIAVFDWLHNFCQQPRT